MSQKYIKRQNKNSHNVAFGKYYATAVYDSHFIGTEELADFIQRQASVKKSDIKAVLQELGEAMKHFFELGQKIKLDGIGIMKVGFSSIGVNKVEDCTSATITTRRVLFQPETERVVVGQEKKKDGTVKQKYVNAITLLKDVVFEETHDNSMNVESEESPAGGSGNSENSGSGNSENSGNGENTENSGSGSGSNTNGTNGTNSVAAPTISGVSPFEETSQVSISGPDGATIYYSENGDDPDANDTLYTQPFTIDETTNIKAIAIKNGVSSQVTTKVFTKDTGGSGGFETGS
jgi:predicted histone-like DNA-binding protein